MQSRAFNFILSEAYRVEPKVVALFTRRLKEAGLLTSGARGVNAPNMTPRDAARATIALLATEQPTRAAEMVKRFGPLPYRPDRSEGPHPEALGIAEGVTFEEVLTRLFSKDLSDRDLNKSAPYVEIQENQRIATIRYGFSNKGAFFQDEARTDEQRNADARDLFGIRKSRGVAPAETDKISFWFWHERSTGETWEDAYRGCDENGYPLDPAHPWNADLPPADRIKRRREIDAYIAEREAKQSGGVCSNRGCRR